MEAILRHFYPPQIIGYIFVVTLFFVVLKKTLYPSRFNEYIQLLFNNKYVLIYSKKERFIHSFTLLGVFIHIIFTSVYIALCLYVWYPYKDSLLLGFEISILFYVAKLILQYFISFIFDISSIFIPYSFIKKSYNNYAALLGFTSLTLAIYSLNSIVLALILSGLVYLFVYILGIWQLIKSFQWIFLRFLFYFILYLCTLEILPCFVVGFLVMKAT